MSDFFKTSEYDPAIYQTVLDNYQLDRKYRIDKWQWDYDPARDPKSIEKVIKSFDCPTLSDFNRELWDLFAEFAEEKTANIIWGSPMNLAARNPEKPTNQYFDGLVFYTTHKEFEGCIKNQDVSHFMSMLVHFGYFNLKFIVV